MDRVSSRRELGGPTRDAFVLHAGIVLATAYRVVRDRAMAQDVAQEVFLRLWVDPAAFGATDPERRARLMVLARSRAIDQIRSQEARRRREERDSFSNHVERAELDEATSLVESRVVREALERLPHLQREPVMLAFFGGLSYRQVAEFLVLPEGTVKARIRAALGQLRGLLEERDLTRVAGRPENGSPVTG